MHKKYSATLCIILLDIYTHICYNGDNNKARQTSGDTIQKLENQRNEVFCMKATFYFFAKENPLAKPWYLSAIHADYETAQKMLHEYKAKNPALEIVMIDVPDQLESSPQKIIRI